MGDDRRGPIADALEHPRRRSVVRHLVDKYLPIPVPSFATYLTLSLYPGEETDDFEAFRTEIHDDLVRDHLPKLDAADIVEYEPDLGDGVIDEGPKFESATSLVEGV